MNLALTKTDTSLWLMRWILRSPNWPDTNPLDLVTLSKKFTNPEVNNYSMILPYNITIISSINKSKEYFNQLLLLDYLLFKPLESYILLCIRIFAHKLMRIY